MNAEIICVGTELLLGNIVNTNATYLSQKLSEIGINVYYQTVVGDNPIRLETNFKTAISRSDIVILTGGLGPTNDDLTKEIVAKSLNLELVEDKESLANIEKFFASQNRVPVASNYKQCLAPAGSVVLPNSIGTAPGYCIEKDNKRIILLPGPPKELKTMFEKSVFPYLKNISDSLLVSHYIRIFGVGESKTEELLGEFIKGENPTVATYAGDGEVMIRVTAKADSKEQGEALCAPVISSIKEILGDNIYAVDSDGLENCVVSALKEKDYTVATAESCTGGMVAQKLTSVAGSSSIFKAGVIAYSNEIKQKELSVSEETLSKYGAVSEQTAAQMAINVRKKENSNLGIGITGVAGPDKSEGKEVGLVYVAIADNKNVWVRKLHLTVGYDRDKIRNYATSTALDLVRRYMLFLPDMLSGGSLHNAELTVLDSQPVRLIKNNENVVETYQEPVQTHESPSFSDDYLFDLMADVFTEDNESKDSNEQAFDSIEKPSELIFDSSVPRKKREPLNIKNSLKKLFTGFLNAFPNKNSSLKDNVFKSIFIVALVGLVVSSSVIGNYFITGNKQKEVLEDTRNIFYSNQSEQESSIDFSPLLKINKDTKAWLKIEGTSIDNPVVISKDNDYYLNHNFNGKKSRYGTLFFDYRDIISESGNSKNLVIYGHNMKDGSMFAGLLKYKNLNFYKQYPTVKLTTPYGTADYQVFSVFLTNSKASDDNGNVFNFLRNSFESPTEFSNWINESKVRSLINTNVDVAPDSEILTLVTCAYDFNDARLVVMAKRIYEEGLKDTSAAKYNPSPKYPQIWYDRRGLKNPYSTDSAVSSTTSSNVSVNETSISQISSALDSSISESSKNASQSSIPVGFVSSSASSKAESKPNSSIVTSSAASSVGSLPTSSVVPENSVSQTPQSSNTTTSEETSSAQ